MSTLVSMEDFLHTLTQIGLTEEYHPNMPSRLRAECLELGLERSVTVLKQRVRHLRRSSDISSSLTISALIRVFGEAFETAEIGVLGTDVVEPLLHHESTEVRVAALDCFAKWARLDPSLVGFLQDAQAQESAPSVRRHCDELLEELRAPLTETGLGFSGGRDTTNLTALVEVSKIPKLLESLLGVSPIVSMDLIECAKTRRPWTRASEVEFDFSDGVTYASCRSWSLSLRREDPAEPDRWVLDISF